MLIVLTENSLSNVIYILIVISASEQQLQLYTTHNFEFPLWGSTYFGSHCIQSVLIQESDNEISNKLMTFALI